MRRLAWIAGAVVLVAWLPAAAAAGPVETGLLARIVATLVLIEDTLKSTNDVVRATKERLADVYPPEAVRPIAQLFAGVRSIGDELQTLACGWRFTPRVQRLWDGIFRGLRLCRGEWQALFGSAPDYVLKDLDEYYDYSSARRLNMVATRVERGGPQRDFLKWLLDEAERGRDPETAGKYSPGYSQRLSAIGAAALGNVLLEQGDTLTARLELSQERANDLRLRQRLETELALDLYAQLADQRPSAAPSSERGRP